MADYGHEETDRLLADLEKKINQVYAQASAEMKKTVDAYFDNFKTRDAQQQKLVAKGELSEEQYTQWRLNQIGRGERFEALRENLSNRMTNANIEAINYVNDSTAEIYSLNRNYAAYTIEQTGADIHYNLYNERAVERLITQEPDLMPNYPKEKAIRRGIDLAYGRRQITANVTSGILQGKSVGKIADGLQNSITDMSRDSAIRAARTAVTEAENAGRQDEYDAAEEMGIEMEKVWMATLDDKTRDAHGEADGQAVPEDEPFEVGGEQLMYPGDDSLGASGWNLYNCRCTMIARVKDVPQELDRLARDENGRNVHVGNITYKEWEAQKNGDGDTL